MRGILLSSSLILVAMTARTATLDVPGDYSTIQDALDAAQEGDTVLVAPGFYAENLTWPATQSIKLVGEEGPSSTFIDGAGCGSVISVDTPVDTTTVITGFTICNGANTRGGGICCLSASPRISDNIISGNSAQIAGGGVSIRWSPVVAVDDNQFQNNVLTSLNIAFGGGLCVEFADSVEAAEVTGNLFQNNWCYSGMSLGNFGGGLAIFGDEAGSSITVHNNEFIANSADGGGGAFVCRNCLVAECLFDGNYAGEDGGGGILVCVELATAIGISRSTFSGNSSTGPGAGIACYDGCNVSVDSSTIADNAGDGVYFGDDGSINFCNIVENSGYGVDGFGGTDATWNWWGDPSGPGGAGPGTGDEVSEGVLYDPWLTEVGIEGPALESPLGLSVLPNPACSDATILFELPSEGVVGIGVYDLAGRLLETMVDGPMTPGEHSVVFVGGSLASGVYLVRLQSGSQVATSRVVLIR